MSRVFLLSTLAWCLAACVADVPGHPPARGTIEDSAMPAAGLFEFLVRAITPPPGVHAVTTGTALFIASDREHSRLLTAAHVVDGCSRIDVLSDNLPVADAALVAADTLTDLAIVRLSEPASGEAASPTTALSFPPLGAAPPNADAT